MEIKGLHNGLGGRINKVKLDKGCRTCWVVCFLSVERISGSRKTR